MAFQIQTLRAFIATGDDGDEGVVAVRLGDAWFPLIAADSERFESFRPQAEAIARESGVVVRVATFEKTGEEPLLARKARGPLAR